MDLVLYLFAYYIHASMSRKKSNTTRTITVTNNARALRTFNDVNIIFAVIMAVL